MRQSERIICASRRISIFNLIVVLAAFGIFACVSAVRAQGDGLVTVTIRPRHARVQQLEPIIKQLMSPSGSLILDERSNSLVLRDNAATTEPIQDTVARLDVSMPSKMFTLKYADAESVADKIAQVIGPAGAIIADSRTHTVYVMASQPNLDLIESLLPTWDKRLPQVLIEADILDVSSAKLKELGVEWELRLGYEGGDHDAVINVNAPRASPDVPSSGAISFGTPTVRTPAVFDAAGNLVTPAQVIVGSDFSAIIQALVEDSSTRTLSRPRILVVDGQAARFEVATLEPYATTSYADSQSAAAMEIKFLDIGIILEAVPHINSDGYILMEIQPEISTLVRQEEFETTIIPDEGGIVINKTRVPVKAQSRATTFVMVRDRQTIVIGGLQTREDEESARKVPLLADIPVLGILFRNLNQSRENRELVIFITPYITEGEAVGGEPRPEFSSGSGQE